MKKLFLLLFIFTAFSVYAESSLLDPISIWAVAIQDAASCVMSCQQPTPNPIR